MKHAFVTGGTGFLGRTLLEQLADEGWQVAALYRGDAPPPFFADHGVTAVRADLGDGDALARAMKECAPHGLDAVFHVAADTSAWRAHRDRQMAVNLDGTRAVIHAMRALDHGGKAGPPRLIHVSSISVWGHHPRPIDETLPQKGRESWVGYVKSKALAEDAVRAAVADGLDAVIVNPAHILGRYDTNNWARLFLLIHSGTLPGVPPGAGSFAHAGAVARAMIAAVEKGGRGENYILGGPHATFLDLAREIARLLDKPQPRRAIPAALLKMVAHGHDLRSRVSGKEPDITPEAAYFVCHDEQALSDRAARVLDYQIVPYEKSLKESHEWLQSQGLLGA
ncbi:MULTISPECIES: NAD-dependent epimerase/dehydratase family protein [unclassified Iodidimonas]|jgi:nucleoside-diphosphate-sugar epimerase|uniref:NAD-dependent epimerase/dehydratase family protein n=1 Tax=unclassified Iodidimonas TaxID=2626145 RepID=UPI0024829F75|nr:MULTISPECIES: NAD-dependent epimerase/dehydratase family protein [unclassified Iodidimonas]